MYRIEHVCRIVDTPSLYSHHHGSYVVYNLHYSAYQELKASIDDFAHCYRSAGARLSWGLQLSDVGHSTAA